MSISIVRLGSPRSPDEGPRLGTVRRPPRGVPRSEFATRDYYDVWLPTLSPSDVLLKAARAAKGAADERAWSAFAGRFRRELRGGEASRLLDLFAALSHTADFTLGCYCEDERRCHRSVLRDLLTERGASIRSR